MSWLVRFSIVLLSALTVLFQEIPSFAQELPSLPDDPAISSGHLPNGVAYYLVNDKSYKGMADFALVCKVGTSCEDSLSEGWVGDVVKAALSSPSRLGGRSIRTFLAGNGMYNGGNGFAEIGEKSIVYRFPGLALSRSETAADSTLLMIFGIIEGKEMSKKDVGGGGVATSSYAIIVSGDIDSKALLNKLKLLSLMIPRRNSDASLPPYEWQHRSEPVCNILVDSALKTPAITVAYSMPRTPLKYMHTILPIVSEHYGNILDKVVCNRLRKELKHCSVPVSSVDCRYITSSDAPGDEKYEVTVSTDEDYIPKALSVISQVLSDIASEGIPVEEYSAANSGCLLSLYTDACKPSREKEEYINACISSFLYGAPTVSKADKFHYFASHSTQDTSMVRHFNRFASAIFGESSNLSIDCVCPTAALTPEELIALYKNEHGKIAGDRPSAVYYPNLSDTLRFVATEAPVKVTFKKKDPVSGGALWQFSNGMRVIYKQMPTGGLLHYSMLVRGGCSLLPDIGEDDEAYLSGVLNSCDVAGIASEDFHNILFSKGITMTGRVSLADTRIYGTAPRSSLNLLIKSLVALVNDGGFASEQRSKDFFAKQFSRMNEGVLIIAGDMDEVVLRRTLMRYLGQFATNGRKGTRISVPYRPVSGWTTRTGDGEAENVEIELSASLQFSAENWFASKIAEKAVYDAMAYALSDASVSLTTDSDLVIYPRERFYLKVSAKEISDASRPNETQRGASRIGDSLTDASRPIGTLPDGTLHVEPLELLFRMRSVLSELSSAHLTADKLDTYKDMLKNEIDSRQNDPWYWIDMVSIRYSGGKDINSKYRDRIDSVTAEKVRSIIASLNENGRVESITSRK